MPSARCVKCLNRMRNVFSGAASMCLWPFHWFMCMWIWHEKWTWSQLIHYVHVSNSIPSKSYRSRWSNCDTSVRRTSDPLAHKIRSQIHFYSFAGGPERPLCSIAYGIRMRLISHISASTSDKRGSNSSIFHFSDASRSHHIGSNCLLPK